MVISQDLESDPAMEGHNVSPAEKADAPSDISPKPSYKSFRRKYRKIMVAFEDKMRESNMLFRENQRMMDISLRLKEQNDQLLELLYDLNRCPHTSPFNFYRNFPPSTSPLRLPDSGEVNAVSSKSHEVPRALHKAYEGLRSGRTSEEEYRQIGGSLREHRDPQPIESDNSLLKVPHVSIDGTNAHDEMTETALVGFPSPHEEDRYMEGLDSYLDGVSHTPRAFATTAGRAGERTIEKDREMALKNPVSVYNWLRKHQPQVFLQDHEAHPEKNSSRTASSRVSKRASAVKQEADLYDEDGIAMETGSSVKGKRKRDDDTGYRPKGGNGRPAKRKKEDGASSAKKSKKAAAG